MAKKKTTCAEIQKNISAFIENELDSSETLAFVDHVRNCESCMEELSVEYLVLVGVKRLDSASAFNLNQELEELIEYNEQRARQKKQTSFFIFVGALLAAIVGGYFLSMFFRK